MSIIEEKNQRLRSDIIKHLYYKRVLSLTDLSKLTKKSLPLVTSFVNGLVSEGYVMEQGLAPSTGGRRPLMFLINPDLKKYIVAIAMDQLVTRLSIYDLSRKMIIPVKMLSFDMTEPSSEVNVLADFINKSIYESGIDKATVRPIYRIGPSSGSSFFLSRSKSP